MTAELKKIKINLLPQKGLKSTTGGRVLFWILSSFRVIVIVTELIVMTAFLSRFWLDAKNTDLKEEMLQKQAIIVAAANFENEFKETQKKVEIFSELTKNEKIISQAIKIITSYLPDDVSLDTFSYANGEIFVAGISPNEKSIQQLTVNLESVDLFESVRIQGIDTDPNNPLILQFRISILLVSN